MSEIEKKALALLDDMLPEDAYHAPDHFIDKRLMWNALCRAIEQHEAFRQEVSDAVEAYVIAGGSSAAHAWARLERFIIAKPDPLVEVCREIGLAPYRPDELRAAIEKRGGKIVWGEG